MDREIPSQFFPLGFVNGGVAAVASVGQGAEFEASVFRANSIIIFGLKDDDITVPQYHAAHLASIFSKHPSLQYHLIEGHHSAFIAPFAERVTDIEHIPAAIDPDGFARLAFLDIGVFG